MPMVMGSDGLVDLLWNDNLWMEGVFDRPVKKINKYNIESLFLALIASNIIDWELCNNKMIWLLQRNMDDQFMFEQDEYWSGINTFPNDYVRKIDYVM